MAGSSKIKVIKCDDYAVMFSGQDMSLKLIPLSLSYVHSDGKEGVISVSTTSDHVQAALENLLPDYYEGQETDRKQRQDRGPAKLTLNISNLCNMACKYCYANGGTYYTNGIIMDENTALNAVNFASKRFPVIEHVNFFGGEPTLNESIIELVCEYFIYLQTQGVLSYLPRFSLTTNGYFVSNYMFQILRKYKFGVTVSLDGPKEVHDRLRSDKNGKGTYEAIVENVRKMTDMDIIPEFECTYTSEHYRSDIDLVDLMDFFYDKFQCRTLHCPIVISKPNSRWFISIETASELCANAIEYSMKNLMRGVPKSISTVTRLLNSLATKTPISCYCPAGGSMLVANADGNLYACFMLMCGEGFCFGNVNNRENESGHSGEIETLLKDADKWQNKSCQECWAQSLCFGCLGEDLAVEGSVAHRSPVPGRSSLCDLKRELIKVFLMSASRVYLQLGVDGQGIVNFETKGDSVSYLNGITAGD